MTNAHRPSYPIDHYDGCHGARLQAVASADRPLCAFVSLVAAARAHKPLRGTLTGATSNDLNQYIADMNIHYDLPASRVASWADSILDSSNSLLDEDQFPDAVGGITLDAYQHDAMAAANCAGVVYSLDCGLGKTATAVATAITAALDHCADATRCWIFCPLNAFGAWRRFLPDLELVFNDVQIISVDSAHKYTACPNTGGVVIFDEVHCLGKPKARRTQAAHKIRATFDHGICLTGTLLHGGVENALSVLDLAIPGAALFASRWSAGEHFNCLVRKKLGQRTVTDLEKPTGPNHLKFVEYLSRHVVAMKKDHPLVKAAFALPQQVVHDVRFMEPWESLDEAVVRIANEQLTLNGELPHMQAVAHLLARDGVAAKVEYVMDELDDTPVVVFANYLESLNAMQKALDDAGILYVRVDGSVTGADRIECQRKFQAGEVQVFLGQETAASISMDLFRASVSVCLDHSWKGTDYAQMLARTCRRGQTEETHHLDLVANAFQRLVVNRVRDAKNFDSSVAEYQSMKAHLDWKRELNGAKA